MAAVIAMLAVMTLMAVVSDRPAVWSHRVVRLVNRYVSVYRKIWENGQRSLVIKADAGIGAALARHLDGSGYRGALALPRRAGTEPFLLAPLLARRRAQGEVVAI